MTYAAKGYFDALVKMGELASESQGSKELGKTLNRGRDPKGPEVRCPQADQGPALCLALLSIGIVSSLSSKKRLPKLIDRLLSLELVRAVGCIGCTRRLQVPLQAWCGDEGTGRSTFIGVCGKT